MTQPTAPDALSATPTELPELFLCEEHVAQAERSLETLAKLRQLALRATESEDWTDISGHPHLNASGVHKIAAAFGVSLTGLRVEALREELDGKLVVRFVAQVTARFGSRALDAEGAASSDDPFFARRDGRPLPLSEVNLNSVRKKAVTNAQGRALKAILGLSGVTWEDVRGTERKPQPVAQVTYARKPGSDGGGRGTGSGNGGGNGHKPGGEPTPMRIMLEKMLEDLAATQSVPFEAMLKRSTEFVGQDGKRRSARSIADMSDVWVRKPLEKLEPEWLECGPPPRQDARLTQDANLELEEATATS
jgi:hypothetical protein